MIILGVFGGHDACAALYEDYRLIAAVALERMTRVKTDGGRFPDAAVDECLAVASLTRADIDVVALAIDSHPAEFFSRVAWWDRLPFRRNAHRRSVLRQMIYQRTDNPADFFAEPDFLKHHRFRPDARIFFYNHHMAHALGALFHTDWDDAILYTADGGGDRLYYSARTLADCAISDIFGDQAQSLAVPPAQVASCSLAALYGEVTGALGFTPLRHEGKVLGLAAFGRPRFEKLFRDCFAVRPDGRIRGRYSRWQWRRMLRRLAAQEPREDIAASLQAAVEDVGLTAVRGLLHGRPMRRLAVSGGLFANVRLNQRIAEECGLDELFVYPAMSDQGQAAGGCLQYLLDRDGPKVWLRERRRLEHVYLGRDYTAREEAALVAVGARKHAEGDVARVAAQLIADGAAVGTYLGRMEYGPRALGARSIMVGATDRTINDRLNRRLARSEFMPFAPVVQAEHADEVFELPGSLRYSANFMTTTCRVRAAWRERIPAIVHVDGTARPQIVSRAQNAMYYDILAGYKAMTGIPVLINTSFNVHEEPIINMPEECAQALKDDRVDAVTTASAIWMMPAGAYAGDRKQST
jgi:carbamoyltransferase